jgi:glycine oxidase
MIAYQTPPGLVQRVVLKDGRYVIPRNDGLLLVGSTLEEAGFDKTTDQDALASLRQSAENIIPALARYPVAYHWAGLRPGSPDGIPFIGALPEFPNVFVNAGHYRNGLVLAPASTHLLVDQLLDREPLIDPAPYLPVALRRG